MVLTDGGIARLRPIRPGDAGMLVDFYARVSAESKYLRFFAPYPTLSSKDIHRFTNVDYVDRVALILTVGEEMLAVGRYDRLDTESSEVGQNQAEVAFLVEDAQQGRGIAQLLLEHLAEAARERGIGAFVAEVLPRNRAMAQVFADAGYRVRREIEDGVLLVEFPIRPTDTSVGVMERREHRAEGASMERLLTPDRVVAIGPADRVQDLVLAMISGGFRGEVIAVSTDGLPVSGVNTANSIAEVDGNVDLVLAAIPTTELGAVVIEAAHKKAHGIVVLTGTKFQVGANQTVLSLARAYGVRALGPDALGLINTDPRTAMNASPGPMPRTGGIGMFCQSAAVGVALLREAVRQNLGLSSFISTGDYADVTGNDVMQFWQDDEATRVCALSLDSIGNPRKFSRIIRRLARRKPVIVFAPGRAQRSGHLANRGGLHLAPAAAVDALFRQSGVCVVHRREEMFDLAQIFARQPLPAGPHIMIITNSWTLSQQMADTARAVGLLPEEPVVLAPLASPAEVAQAAREALAAPSCDAVVCAIVRAYSVIAEGVHEALGELAASTAKPLLGVFLDFSPVTQVTDESPDLAGGLPTFSGATDALQALAAVAAYAHWRERDPGAVPLLDNDEVAAKRVINRVLAETPQGRELNDAESTEVLGAYGIHLVPRYPVGTLDEAIREGERLGWDVVLKATAAAVRGRPDLASVYRNIGDAEEMADAWEDLGSLVGELGLADGDGAHQLAQPVVQAMLPAGVPLVVSSHEDAAFGPVVSVGLDGIATELLGDVAYRVPPLTTVDAAAMVRDLKAAPTLFGRHGSPRVDVERVEQLLHRVAQMSDDLPQLSMATLSPCIAAPNGLSVLGARFVVVATGDHRDPLARVLG